MTARSPPMPDAVQFIQSLVNGVGVGLIYGLVGIGFCVIYNASGIVNFAQGVFVMLGGMACEVLLRKFHLPLPIAFLIAVPFVALVGLLMEVLVVRPMWNRGSPLFAIILATLATQIMIERITILTVDEQPHTFQEFTLGGPLKIGAIAIPYQLFWIVGCGALMVGLLWLFFTRTRAGRALRACSQNREAAALLGIPVGAMLLLSFALSAALGAVAGILVTPMQAIAFNSGTPFGVSGFIAAIIGGFGNAAGALAGGILLGVLQAVAIVLLGAGFKNVAALTALLFVLFLFPSGLFAGLKPKAH
ncbi:hypothetical protein ABB55_19600 [Prosthecomicrobium hirschii]|uniref:ABC transporter permease n=2 Tax=Prosthecodimorpha TaxID=2981530 RepID=A0A0N8GFF1_9HYPH|nr:hypothetical protein ABB55_19600 [Prosthecomicrobium hirschii]